MGEFIVHLGPFKTVVSALPLNLRAICAHICGSVLFIQFSATPRLL